MPLVDDRGRVFGRFNLIDAAAIAFVVLLVPAAYGSYLLFRPAKPTIESVTQVAITREERRLAGGSPLSAKLKVRGSGLNPMLRAAIGDTAAMGFVFETPNSADVLVGRVPPGTHDLVLFDGVQEVARARAAVTIEQPSSTRVRLVGRLLDLDPAAAAALAITPAGTNAETRIVALGPVQAGRERLRLGDRAVEIPRDGFAERDAVLDVSCDPQAEGQGCAVGGMRLDGALPLETSVNTPQGVVRMSVSDVLPTMAAERGTVRVRFATLDSTLLREGDRDALLDDRAAVISAVSGSAATLQAGLDPSIEGWRYRGKLVVPGAEFVLTTTKYRAVGVVQDVTLSEKATR